MVLSLITSTCTCNCLNNLYTFLCFFYYIKRLEDDLKSKEEKIEQLKKEFDDKIYQLEKQAVLDKDRYKINNTLHCV